MAIHATLTARDVFLAYFYTSGPFIYISQNLSLVFSWLAVANTDSSLGPQNKTGHPVGCRFPCSECPRNINRLQNMYVLTVLVLLGLRSEIIDIS